MKVARSAKYLTFAHYAKVVGDGASLVAHHVVVDFADSVRGVVPCFVAEVGVGRH